MRRRVIGLCVLIVVLCVAPAFAQQSSEMLTCEQRVSILSQLVGDLSTHRSSVEVEAAALKVRTQILMKQIEVAKEVVKEPK